MPNSPQQSPDDWTAELEKSKMKNYSRSGGEDGSRGEYPPPHKDAVLPIHAIFERQLVGKGIPEYFPGTSSEDDSPGRSLNAEQSDDPAVEALRPASRESGAPQTEIQRISLATSHLVTAIFPTRMTITVTCAESSTLYVLPLRRHDGIRKTAGRRTHRRPVRSPAPCAVRRTGDQPWASMRVSWRESRPFDQNISSATACWLISWPGWRRDV